MTREYLHFLLKLVKDARFRTRHLEFRRLSKIPRYQRCSTNLLGYPLEIIDTSSFFSMYQTIFEDSSYEFVSERSSPFIIDGGANIGMSTIYFKRLFPDSRVIAFEPDPMVFEVLARNLQGFGFDDVELHQSALWYENTKLGFHSEGADSGRIEESKGLDNNLVVAERLKDYLTETVDLLKLDIEGAETEVLLDCRNELENVENLFVEYHSFVNESQKIDQLIKVLSDVGFRIVASSSNRKKHPFTDRSTYLGMDFQLDVFAYRT